MSNCADIGCGIKPFDRWLLHAEGQEAGEDAFTGSAKLIKLFKCLGAIIDRVSDGLINIGSQIGSTAKAVIVKLGMVPGTKGTKFSGKFYRAFYGADELMAPTVLGFVIKFAFGEHFKTSNANGNTGAG